MKYFSIVISKLLIWVLNYTSKNKSFYISNSKESDNILIEKYYDSYLFTNKKNVIHENEVIDFFKFILEDLDNNTCFLMIGNYTSVELIQNLKLFNGKVYIIEFSKFQYELQFLTNNLLDINTKSRLILFNYDLNFKNSINLFDLIYDYNKISFVRLNELEIILYIIKNDNQLLLNKPIIFLEKINLKKFIDLNFITLFKSYDYHLCTIQIINKYNFINLDDLNLNYLKHENVDYVFKSVNLFIYDYKDSYLNNYVRNLAI
jgi:hypothetical protein